ncbi:MAG: hypothetical protein RJA07_139 [Bacteroidota bacterium]
MLCFCLFGFSKNNIGNSDSLPIVSKKIAVDTNGFSFQLKCFELSSFPVPLSDSINFVLKNCLRDDLIFLETLTDIKSVIEAFISQKNNSPTTKYEGNFSVITQSKNLISLNYFSSHFNSLEPHGGLNSEAFFQLNKKTGASIKIEDLIDDEKITKFEALDKNYFIKSFNESFGNFSDTIATLELKSNLNTYFYFDKIGIHRKLYGWVSGSGYLFDYLIPMKELKPLLRKDFEW